MDLLPPENPLRQILRKGVFHWLITGLLIGLGLYLSHWLGSLEEVSRLRYQAYQVMPYLRPHPPYTQRTVLVLVGNEEYWKGELAGRAPIKRDYLAKLIRALDSLGSFGPTVIALDFDLSSPFMNGDQLDHQDYQHETEELINAINAVSENRTVVLPVTISRINQDLVMDPAVFCGAKISCPGGINGEKNTAEKGIRFGHISPPKDLRLIPLQRTLKGGEHVDSFAQAIVRAVNPGALLCPKRSGRVPRELPCKGHFEALPYGEYMEKDEFQTLSAQKVIDNPKSIQFNILNPIVIIGAYWQVSPFREEKLVDSYFTPVGELGGVYIHANYVEALLGQHTLGSWGKSGDTIVEIFLSLILAAVFALRIRPRSKLLATCFLGGGLVLSVYVFYVALGIFFDCIVPFLLLGAHLAVEQAREWHKVARRYTALFGKA